MSTSQQINYNFTGNTKSLENSVDRAIRVLGKYDNTATKLMSGVSSITRIIAGIGIGAAIEKTVKQSINYVENLNLFTVAMGESIDAGKKFVSQLQEIYGMDPNNVLRYTATFNELAVAIDTPAKAAENMSLGLTKMGVDIASLFNLPLDTVMENLGSGMQGMTRAVRKYGVDIRAVTLQQTAATLGIQAQVRSMSEADRMGLRYITMLRQTANSQGDLAKTIESPANQLRILTEQISQLARAVGNLLLGSVAAVLPYLNGFVMAIREIITALGALLGFKAMGFGGATDAAKDLKDETTGIGTAADKTAKKLNKLIAPFDQLNLIRTRDTSASSAGVGSYEGTMNPLILEELDKLQRSMESIKMKANSVRDAILNFLGVDFKFDPDGNIVGLTSNLQKLKDNVQSLTGINLDPLFKSFASLKEALTPITEKLFAGLKWAWDNVLQPYLQWEFNERLPAFIELLASAFDFLDAILEVIAPDLEYLWDSFLEPIAKWIGTRIIEDIKNTANALRTVSDWMRDNKEIISTVTGIVNKFFGAWQIVDLVSRISKNWGKITAFFTGLGTTITGVWNKVLEFFAGLHTKIVAIFLQWAPNILVGLAPVLKLPNTIVKVWEPLKTFFSQLATSIGGYFRGMVNGVVDGINRVISGMNKLSLPATTIPGIGQIGGWGINIPHIPRLANGAITNGPMMAVIGDNPGGREVVSPLEELKDILASVVDTALANSKQSGSTIVLKIGETEFGRVAINAINTAQQRAGKTLLVV